MTVIVAAIVGFLAGRLIWLALRKTWQRQVFMRKNFHGTALPTAAGIVLPLALLIVEAGRAVAGGFGIGDEPAVTAARGAALVAIIGFSLLGLLDDLAGGGEARGFSGHVRALSQGQLTNGSVKTIGGIALALVASAFITGDAGGVALVLNAAIIVLAANLLDILDFRPGRASKAGMVGFVILAAAALLDVALVPVAIVVGATAALLHDDLRERLMMGDTGANALGTAIGIGIVTQVGGTGRVIAFAALLLVNLGSEFVSFSKIIESTGPLRALDDMGRRSTPMVDLRDEPESDTPSRQSQASPRVTVGGAQESRASTARPSSSRTSDAEYADQRPIRSHDEPRSERPFSDPDLTNPFTRKYDDTDR